MSNKSPFARATGIATALVLGAAVLTSGCTATGGTYGGGAYRPTGTAPYIPPRAEPQSCRNLRQFDQQIARQTATGNSRITTGIIGAVTGALLGNESTRDAGIGAAGGAVVGEVYTKAQQRAARANLAAQCESDYAALQRGTCVWNSNTGETTRVVNGRPVEVFQGDARRSINCEGIGGPVDSYAPPNR